MFKNFSKENVLLGFYVIYILVAGLLFELFPGNDQQPNGGVLMLYLFIPISIVYFMIHLIRQLFGKIDHTKCMLIHGAVWASILIVLTIFKS